MARWYRIFFVEDVGRIYERFDVLLASLRELSALGVPEGPALERRVRKILLQFVDGLDLAARDGSVAASEAIRERITATQKRPSTRLSDDDTRPGLEGAIFSSVLRSKGGLSTGAVGVASIDSLNRLTRRAGKWPGPYWTSQEYGYQPRGKQITGIRGFFTGPGMGLVPPSRSDFRQQSVFITRRGPLMRPSGYDGRFFLRDGSDKAFTAYESELRKLESRIDAELGRILV